MKVARSVVVQGQDEYMTLRLLLDAIDLVAAKAPDTARVKVYSDEMGAASSLGPFFHLAFGGKEATEKWFIGARWDETVGEDKPAKKPAPAAAATEAEE